MQNGKNICKMCDIWYPFQKRKKQRNENRQTKKNNTTKLYKGIIPEKLTEIK